MAQVEGVTSPELARLLERHRDEINAAFRRQGSARALERPGEFLDSFRSLAEAAVGSMQRDPRLGESSGPAVAALFRAWLGAWGKAPGPSEGGLRALMGAFPGPMARDPERFLGSSLNAMAALAGHSEASLDKWLKAMSRLGGAVAGLDDFLNAGLAAAWLSGLPQYRRAALKALPGLPRAAVSSLLGLGKADPGIDPVKAVESLSADPWFDPAAPKKGAAPPQACFAAVGGWRGYGGRFSSTPMLWCDGEGVLAGDGRDCCRIYADRWGAALVSEPHDGPGKADGSQAPGFGLTGDGFRFGGLACRWEQTEPLGDSRPRFAAEELPASSSVAFGNAVFFSHPLSFRVFIIGLPAGANGKHTRKKQG